MRRSLGHGIIGLCLGLIVASLSPQHAEAASDPRFFGTYCGTHVVSFVVRVRFLFFTVREERRTLTFAVRAHANYVETPRGDGLVSGSGTVTEGGTTAPFSFSGVVTAPGHLQGSGIAHGVDPVSGTASLGDDGNTLVVRGMDQRVILRKEACGNTAPSVAIERPAPGAFLWGQSITFSGRASDREDATVPDERLVWTSSRDGRLGTGRTVTWNYLSPGTHTVSFAATDSGGLSTGAAIVVTIENNPPNPPRIEQPASGATYYVGQEIPFRGWATDREQGALVGGSLVWRSDGMVDPLGTGSLLRRSLPEGIHTISLTATDRQGASNSTAIRVTVLPRPAGNTPPTVTITSPESYTGMADSDCLTLVAEAFDLEEGRLSGASLVWEDRYLDGAVERVRALGSGERIELCRPFAGTHDTWHAITVRATDAGGLSFSNSIRVYVIPGGGLI